MEELHPEHDIESEYQAYLAADPENSDLIYLSGRAMKDIDASLALFRRAAEADPPSAYGAYALAYYHLCAGEFDDATPLDRARRTVVIRVRDESGEEKAAFEILEAWPCKYDPIETSATGNEIAVETLELCNEGIRRMP